MSVRCVALCASGLVERVGVCACVRVCQKAAPAQFPSGPVLGTLIKDSIATLVDGLSQLRTWKGQWHIPKGARIKREGRGAWLGKWKRGLLPQKGIFVALVAARE